MGRLKIKFFGSVVLAALFLNSCYYDKADKLYGGNVVVCDTANSKFGLHVLPIIQKNCTNIGCHVQSNPSGSILLETYSDVSSVVPSNRLTDAIKQIYPPGNAKNMPPAAGKINVCDIARIEAWIANGALNN